VSLYLQPIAPPNMDAQQFLSRDVGRDYGSVAELAL
jgi:hypothetical protein